MKDNPVQQLDLLKAQLAKCTNSNTKETTTKLASTKHLLDRLEKSGRLSSDPKQLRHEILSVKREIVLRKLHFATNIVKRTLKQFKKVEPLRIAKRVKLADCATKKSMLEREHSELKESNTDQWAEEIAKRALSKQFDVEAVTGLTFSKRTLSTAEINLFSRIGKTDAVRAAISQLLELCSGYFEAKEPDSIGSQSSNCSASKGSPAVEPPAINNEGNEKKRKSIDLSETDDQQYENSINSTSKQEGERVDAFFEQPVSTFRDDDSSDEEQEDGTTREGLPALAEWYISPSEDEEVVPDPVAQPAKKNRRGQRARRKIWEQKFGQRANHVLKQKQEEEIKRREKEQKMRRKADREFAVKKQKIEFASRPLHPSWEARQKQKQSTENVKFEGKKMKFD